jgi:Flp pilus assembly protein TadD
MGTRHARHTRSGPKIFAEDVFPMTPPITETKPEVLPADVIQRLQAHFLAERDLRRGICLLNAGQFDDAALALSRAAVHRPGAQTIATMLAACFLGRGDPTAAAAQFGRATHDSPSDPVARIRHALALWSDGRRDRGIDVLRETVRIAPEHAEVHFQLGVLLLDRDARDEAELRFVQAVNLQSDHTEARVHLAMCRVLRGDPEEALEHLRHAQRTRPDDARVALLLAQAAQSVRQRGRAVDVRAAMPPEPKDDLRGIEELAALLEREPDFVDAFMALPPGEVDLAVYAVLLRTLEKALERAPEAAELHFHCGQVLTRLGRMQEAIDANERAVGIQPRYTRALIALGRLYEKTERTVDAMRRLEQAIEAGAEYADVFYLLGNLYRHRGNVRHARRAYTKALSINERYKPAREALQALPV